MKYFKIKMSTNQQVIGKSYPQVCKLKNSSDYDRDSSQSIYNVGVWDQVLPDSLILPHYSLDYFSKRTDLLSVAVHNSNVFLLISKKLFDLVSNNQTPSFSVFETQVFSRGKPYEYFLLYMPPTNIGFHDLESSKVKYDIFRLARPVTGYFVSDHFKNLYEKGEMTGIEFIPFEKIKDNMINKIK